MFNYQFNSVMSMGVMLFQVYMLFLVCWCAVIFKEDIMAFIQRFMPKLGFVGKIINVLERFNWSCRSYSLHLSRCARGLYRFLTFSIDQLPNVK